jgi:hypothetical protein
MSITRFWSSTITDIHGDCWRIRGPSTDVALYPDVWYNKQYYILEMMLTCPLKETTDNSFRVLHRYKRASCLVGFWFNHRLITKFLSWRSSHRHWLYANYGSRILLSSYDISDNYPLHVKICPSAILTPSPLVTAIFSFGTFSFVSERTLPFSPQQREKE